MSKVRISFDLTRPQAEALREYVGRLVRTGMGPEVLYRALRKVGAAVMVGLLRGPLQKRGDG